MPKDVDQRRQGDRAARRHAAAGVLVAHDGRPGGCWVALEHAGARPRLADRGTGEPPQRRGAAAVSIAPPGRTIARTHRLEAMDAAQLADALAVLAEGELPDRAPAHRRACGVLPGCGSAGRTAVLTAWLDLPPERPGKPAVSEAHAAGHRSAADQVPDHASSRSPAPLASAGAALGRVVTLDGGCAFLAEAATGVLVLAACGPGGLVIRTLREAAGGSGTPSGALGRLEQACEAAGVDPAAAADAMDSAREDGDRWVGVCGSCRRALESAVEGWEHSSSPGGEVLCLGAALLARDDDPLVASLASLHEHAPAERAGLLERADAWLASRAHVGLAVGVCAALVLLTPIAVGLGRAALLVPRLEAAERRAQDDRLTERQAALYRQAEARTLPMTKLLAEVAAAAPPYLVLEGVRLDASTGVDVEGFVRSSPSGPAGDGPPEALVTRFESALNELGTLASVTVRSREIVEDAVRFRLTAQVRDASVRGDVPADYAELTLAEVLYGQGASNTADPLFAAADTQGVRRRPAARTARADAERTPARPTGGSGSGASGGSAEAVASDRRPSGEAASVDGAPAPLTEADMDAMDRAQLMRAWRVRLSASRDESLDADTRARLADEAEELNERFRAAGSGS